MKHTFFFLLVLALALSLCACGGKNPVEAAAPPTAVEASPTETDIYAEEAISAAKALHPFDLPETLGAYLTGLKAYPQVTWRVVTAEELGKQALFDLGHSFRADTHTMVCVVIEQNEYASALSSLAENVLFVAVNQDSGSAELVAKGNDTGEKIKLTATDDLEEAFLTIMENEVAAQENVLSPAALKADFLSEITFDEYPDASVEACIRARNPFDSEDVAWTKASLLYDAETERILHIARNDPDFDLRTHQVWILGETMSSLTPEFTKGNPELRYELYADVNALTGEGHFVAVYVKVFSSGNEGVFYQGEENYNKVMEVFVSEIA